MRIFCWKKPRHSIQYFGSYEDEDYYNTTRHEGSIPLMNCEPRPILPFPLSHMSSHSSVHTHNHCMLGYPKPLPYLRSQRPFPLPDNHINRPCSSILVHPSTKSKIPAKKKVKKITDKSNLPHPYIYFRF